MNQYRQPTSRELALTSNAESQKKVEKNVSIVFIFTLEFSNMF